MNEHEKEVLFSSDKTNWRTPQWLLDELDKEFDFFLDAAADETNAKCADFLTEEDDALSMNWDCGGTIWVNPPYGRTLTPQWVKKMSEQCDRGNLIVALLPARTDTRWFHQYIYKKHEVRFIKGRLKFQDNDGNTLSAAPFPSMLVIFRPSWM